MTRPPIVTIVAIAAAALLEAIALLTHTDGRYFGLALAAIAGLGGYHLGKRQRPT